MAVWSSGEDLCREAALTLGSFLYQSNLHNTSTDLKGLLWEDNPWEVLAPRAQLWGLFEKLQLAPLCDSESERAPFSFLWHCLTACGWERGRL